jgi:hypothetical protein
VGLLLGTSRHWYLIFYWPDSATCRTRVALAGPTFSEWLKEGSGIGGKKISWV